ncbi:alpha/beta hydrolase [Methylobacillus gramineus]|uniref:alpha/beta hydrolase fold domain-containing protein n=1 Tax=Methylobacillus gramineus TaxID=755169 RepID=UPI001CFFFB82|nr:alpha/beta hydrolase fold domain-containing protein [Methylobacillus gramineus]MCB5184649.1 alpha/beta hydrolase [Methylobacillus gramineus]
MVKPVAPAFSTEEFIIPGPGGAIPVRLYRPGTNSPKLPLVLYFHGGGFSGGSLDDAEYPAHFIASHCPALVLSVGYSLAPLHPFPAAPEEAYAAAIWAARNAKRLGASLELLVVAGDDAGGNIAASLTLMARDRAEVHIAAQVLIGPMLDPSMTRLGDAEKLKSDLTAEQCAKRYQQYLPTSMQRMHPYAAPLECLRLAGLPTALIATAECDVLHVEAEKYAAALISAGVPTQVSRFTGIKHAELHTHLPVMHDIVNFLRRQSQHPDLNFNIQHEDHHA